MTGTERIATAEKAHARWSDVRARLLVSAGQRINTGRLAAIVDTSADGGLGTNWKPIQGTDDSTATCLGGLAEQHPRPNRHAEEPRQKHWLSQCTGHRG